MANKYQLDYIKKHNIKNVKECQSKLKNNILLSLYENIPTLEHSYKVFTPFKNKVIAGIKGKHYKPENKHVVNEILKMLKDKDVNKPTDISSYVSVSCLGFIDSIIIAKTVKSSYLLEQFLWRIFYYQAEVDDESLQDIKWKVDKDLQHKFFTHQTGFPLIDASINCLVHTGKLDNKLRMVVASFFCKNMLQPWTDGEKFFKKYLEDYDRIVNRGNWIWCSQIKYDNQIFIRFFKPDLQLKKLIKTNDGKEWYEMWKTKPCKEILDWDKSCDMFRKLKSAYNK